MGQNIYHIDTILVHSEDQHLEYFIYPSSSSKLKRKISNKNNNSTLKAYSTIRVAYQKWLKMVSDYFKIFFFSFVLQILLKTI